MASALNPGDLTLLHSLASGAVMMDDWPPAGALIGRDDFIGFSHSPQPSTSPSAAMLLSYEAPSSPSPSGLREDLFGHQQQQRHNTIGSDQYGSEGISPSPSSYVSSSCSSLQSEDHQYQSQQHSHVSSVLQYQQPGSGQHATPSSSNIAAPHIMVSGDSQNMLSCFDQSPYRGSPPGYALAMSPPIFSNQSKMLFSASSANNSNYPNVLTQSPLQLPSFASNLTNREHSGHKSSDLSLKGLPPRQKSSNSMKTVVVKGELSEDSEEGGLLEGYNLEEDYSIPPPENFFQLEEEEESTAGSTHDYGPYGLMPLDTSGMLSSSSSSPSMSALSREMILQDKMMPLPPAKTRSKMHDLAVKHQLITNQNTRGQGSIQLSAEEKRTLLQEGYTLPTRLPLSRDEEEALKVARRKIKNKLSAQESRRKRKEYMDSLEKKVHAYFGDNVLLKNRVKQLEALNKDLLSQVKKLQNVVAVENSCSQL